MASLAELRFKTYILLFLMVVFGPTGDVLLSKGMKGVGALTSFLPSELLHFFFRTFTSSTVWLGIGSLTAFFISYTCVLSWADFSYVQPASSMAYGVVALMGYFLLGETVTATRWFGVFIICVGVFIVGHTSPSTTESRS